jgi:hypothetical protein
VRGTTEGNRLLTRVHAQRGNGRVFTIDVPDPVECKALVDRFDNNRNTEYVHVQERIGMLMDEITSRPAGAGGPATSRPTSSP